MSLRIEFTERYIKEVSEEAVERAKNLKQPRPEGEVVYRRIYIRLADIFAPKEIPGKKNHCIIEYVDGVQIIVKGSYDLICNLIDDRENMDKEPPEPKE